MPDLFVVSIVMFALKDEKEAGVGPFLKNLRRRTYTWERVVAQLVDSLHPILRFPSSSKFLYLYISLKRRTITMEP